MAASKPKTGERKERSQTALLCEFTRDLHDMSTDSLPMCPPILGRQPSLRRRAVMQAASLVAGQSAPFGTGMPGEPAQHEYECAMSRSQMRSLATSPCALPRLETPPLPRLHSDRTSGEDLRAREVALLPNGSGVWCE